MPRGSSDPLLQMEPALLATAITPGLRSILLFDADRFILDAVATTLEQMLSLTTGRVVVRRYLGAAQQEDDLWIRSELSYDDGRLAVTLRPGALAGELDEKRFPLLVIPDLAELGLATTRGCVTLMDAGIAHMERHGVSHQWVPDACWLAACDRAAVGKVSPHVLDRFAVRLDASCARSAEGRPVDIRRWAIGEPGLKPRLSTRAIERLSRAADRRPEILSGMLERVLDIRAINEGSSHRRDIALARLAVACARLDDLGTAVGDRHVDQAALLLDLPLPVMRNAATRSPADAETPPSEATNPPKPASHFAVSGGEVSGDFTATTEGVDLPMAVPEAPELLSSAELPEMLAGPYPEDHAARERDVTALREAPARSRSTTVPRGSIVGVEQARSTHDLALLSTVLAAAIWQTYRRMHAVERGDDGRLRLLPSDLRSYRRAPAPEQLLALVIDFTCLEHWDWTAPLMPYLRWAYVERAGILLVRVGAADSPTETRADRLVTRNLLDPRLDIALSARPGRATPLAHGLFLTLQALLHGLQHGEGNVRRARLIVVTDGRGNVPLELDSSLNVVGTVGRTGIDDTLEIAASIRKMAAVEVLLVDPEPDVYPELVLELAQALGAEVVRGRTLETAEGGEPTR